MTVSRKSTRIVVVGTMICPPYCADFNAVTPLNHPGCVEEGSKCFTLVRILKFSEAFNNHDLSLLDNDEALDDDEDDQNETHEKHREHTTHALTPFESET